VGVWVGARMLAYTYERVALLNQHAMSRHISICSLSVSTLFFGVISQTARLVKKKIY
jgi:hypothetical protein